MSTPKPVMNIREGAAIVGGLPLNTAHVCMAGSLSSPYSDPGRSARRGIAAVVGAVLGEGAGALVVDAVATHRGGHQVSAAAITST